MPPTRRRRGARSKRSRRGVYLRPRLGDRAAKRPPPRGIRQARPQARRLGLEVEVLGEKEMSKLGMHSLVGVGLGSERESQLLVMQWKGAQG